MTDGHPVQQISQNGTRSAFGSVAVWGTGSMLLLFTAVAVPFFVVPWLPRKRYGALPYLPTSERRIKAMLAALPPDVTRPGKRFVDLGSGDGVAVLAAARSGMHAVGVELNPSLVAISWMRAFRHGLTPFQARIRTAFTRGDAESPSPNGTARFELGNIFAHPVDKYDVIMAFGVVPLMPRIAAKLAAEAPVHAAFASHKFPLPPRFQQLTEALSSSLPSQTRANAAGARAGAVDQDDITHADHPYLLWHTVDDILIYRHVAVFNGVHAHSSGGSIIQQRAHVSWELREAAQVDAQEAATGRDEGSMPGAAHSLESLTRGSPKR